MYNEELVTACIVAFMENCRGGGQTPFRIRTLTLQLIQQDAHVASNSSLIYMEDGYK